MFILVVKCDHTFSVKYARMQVEYDHMQAAYDCIPGGDAENFTV